MSGTSRRVMTLQSREFERILLIKPSSLGDVIHALPVLHGLRKRYPRARIDWLISRSFDPFLHHHPALTGTVPFDRQRFGRMGVSPRITADFIRFVRELRRARYELAIDLQGLFRTGFLSWACGAPFRLGFRAAREGASLFYTHRMAVDDSDMHAVDRNYVVANWLGFASVPIDMSIPIDEETRTQVGDLLATVGIGRDDDYVLVAPGARWATKVWPVDRFAATIDALHDRGERRIVMVGSSDERTLCGRVAQRCRSTPVNLAGQTSLGVLPAVIDRADLVICHDSAVMHLAVALNRPLVCLIGPTNPHRTGPYQRLGDVVRREFDCAPCYLRRLAQCRHDHRCMNELGVSQVLDAIDGALRRICIAGKEVG